MTTTLQSSGRRTGKTAIGVVLAVLALIPVGVLILFIARGVLYGLVDQGPYDTSWGGPSRSGAWSAHFLVGLPLAAASLFALHGLRRLRARWNRLIDGESGNRWVIPTTVLIVAAAAVLFWAWTRQI